MTRVYDTVFRTSKNACAKDDELDSSMRAHRLVGLRSHGNDVWGRPGMVEAAWDGGAGGDAAALLLLLCCGCCSAASGRHVSRWCLVPPRHLPVVPDIVIEQLHRAAAPGCDWLPAVHVPVARHG
jgi:hypothetical protein